MDVFSQCRAAGRAAVEAANQHTPDHELKSIYDLAYKNAYNQYEQARTKAHGGSSIRKRKTTKTRKIRRNFMR